VVHAGDGLSNEGPLRLGDRGETVVALRQLIERVTPQPLDAPSPDTFDAGLEAAVRGFQQRRGLVADGIVGTQTRRALEGARWRLGDRPLHLTLGTPGDLMRGDDVAALQERLVVLGLLPGPVDASFGTLTDRALRELQRSLGVEPDGVCGATTLRAMEALARAVGGGDPWALRQQAEVAEAGLSLAGKVVVLDPAHGAGERGVSAHGLHEDEVVFDIATRTAARLGTIGVVPVLTREACDGPDQRTRAARAAEVGADVVVSLHCDALTSPHAAGVATFFWGDDRVGARSATGERLASLVQREIVARTGMADLRTHACTFDILRVTKMPAVQVELGYLTHPSDAARLADPEFRDHVAEALVVAIQRLYLGDEDAVTGTLRLADVLEYARLVESGVR
jgi:N-acetylmuramoyl-L-alanine amidase